MRSIVAALVAWWIEGAADAGAQQPAAAGPRATRSAVVTFTTATITIDGTLDEPIWRSAPPIGELIQRQPNPGDAPTERTAVTLLRDQDNLYVGVIAYDSEPDRVIGTQMARDGAVGSDDRIEILLDTFRDRRSAFYFATNPAGALVDGLAFANGQLNTEWDAIWNVRTRRTNEGWIAEFAIPFKSLSFPAGKTTWGFNVARNIYRKLEDGRWSGARLETQFLQVSEAGEITNLEGLTQGLALDVRPFIAGRWLHLGSTSADDFNQKPGLDLFYNVTPSLKLTATFNTDFGETEVDARQINLSRFSLLFPEKRSFFLEGAGVFSFASTGPEVPGGIPATGADVYPFFSRQVGLLAGEEVPLDAGVKLTGTIGRTDVGVLDVRTSDLSAGNVLKVDEKNFFVGRVKRNLFRQSYIGALFTDGHPALGQSGQTYGADLRLATSRFLGAPRNFVVNAYGVRSVNEERKGNDWSYGFSAHYPNDRFLAQVVFREVQENFRPALGFVQRDNVQLFRVAGSYNPRPRKFLNIQQLNHDVFYTRFTRLDNKQVESWDLYVTLLDWHFKSGDSSHGMLDFQPTYERLFEPFEISPGVDSGPRRVPVHTLQELSDCDGVETPDLGQPPVGVGQLLVGRSRTGHGQRHLQGAAAADDQREHESDVRPLARRAFHRAHLHHQRKLRRVSQAVVLESHSIRQPFQESGLAEPHPLDAAAGQRFLLCVQPGLDSGNDRHPPVPISGQQGLREVSILLPVLT